MRPIPPARVLAARLALFATVAVAATMALPGDAEARKRTVSWSSAVAMDDLRWELRADRRKGIRLRCTPVEGSHVWGDNFERHECWAGWGKSRSWYRTAYSYRAMTWPSFYSLQELDYGWCKVGKRWRKVVQANGQHIKKCKSTRREA